MGRANKPQTVTSLAAVLVLMMSSLAFAAADGTGFSELRALDTNLPFCLIAKQYHVPPELLAGVFFFENQLNRGVKDTIEDAAFRVLLSNTEDSWWENWAEQTMRSAQEAEGVHLLSNKWPTNLVATGAVVSIGPAQVTPLTALRACSWLRNNAVCSKGVKRLILAMLEAPSSIEVAAIVLQFEAQRNQLLTGDEVSGNPGVWATIYNVGGDYYRKAYRPASTNQFGNWVRSHVDQLGKLLNCTDGQRE